MFGNEPELVRLPIYRSMLSRSVAGMILALGVGIAHCLCIVTTAQAGIIEEIFSDAPIEPVPGVARINYEGPPPAPGVDEEVDEIFLLRQELQDLRARLNSMEETDRKKPAADKPAEKKTSFPTFKTTGFLQLDSGLYSQSENNKATIGNAQNGTGFRRARLAVLGNVAEFTAYQIEMDFATAGRPSFFDTYVEQSNVPYLNAVRVGQFCQPFSVDALTGFRNLTFLERSLPFLAFVPFRRVGAMSSTLSDDEMSTFAISVYRTGGYLNAPLGDNRFATDIGDIGGISVSMRGTHLIRYDENADDRYLWHIGASYNYSVLGANTAEGSATKTPFYQTRVLPEFGMLGYSELSQPFGAAYNGTPSFIDSGRYPANHFNLVGLETVYQNGPWGITSEYMATIVDSIVGPIFYQGAYAQAAYRLTGEHRRYNRSLATLGRLDPFADFIPLKKGGVRGWGAWEVAGRISFVDIRNPDSLNGHYLNLTTDEGNGVLTDTTLGFTWFLNAHTKLQGNWIHCMLNNRFQGKSTADLFVSRVQVDF